MIDLLVESYQGLVGVMPLSIKPISIEVPILEKLKSYADELQKTTVFGERNGNTYLYNQIDEIITIIRKTIYKLENLI